MPLKLASLRSTSSLGLRFFGSFAALFLTFLVLSNLVLFRVFVPQFEAEIQSLNDLILRSTQIALDERVFRSIEAEYLDVALNRASHDFFYPMTNDPLENLWRPVESIGALRDRIVAADFEPHAISIFFPRWKYVLSSQGFKSLDQSSSILEFSWAYELLDGSRHRWQRGDAVVDYNVSPHVYAEMLRFIGPYPPSAATSEPLAYIVVETPMSSVETIVAMYADFSPGVFWVARDGSEVLFSNRTLSSAREVTDDPAYVYSSILSEVSGLSYHYAIPRDVLFERAINVRNGLYYTMIITVLLSLVVSWLIARYLGRPIAEIARTAERVSQRLHLEPQESGANELVRIETTIEGLARRIERNAPMVQEKFFADLLNGVIAREEIERRMVAMSLGNLPPIVQVGILVQRTATTTASEDARGQILQLLPQITTDFVLFYFPIDHEQLALISAANDEDEFTEFCHDLHDRLRSLRDGRPPRSAGRDRLVLSLGPPVASLADIAASYDVARSQLPFYFVSDNPILVPMERDESDPPPSVDVPTEDQIGEVLATEDLQTIGDFLEGVRDALRESDEDIHTLNQKVCTLASRIRRFIAHSARRSGSIGDSLLDCDFSHFETLGELLSSWRDDIAAYFAELLDGRHDNNSNLVQRARDYLDEHFVDDISLSALAERYKVSYSHLSKLFHDYSGLTFREYLLTLRLEKAAELLLSTDLPVKRVAYESGFRDTGYFIRQFKRKHGLTPVNYRKRGGGAEPG